MRTIWARQSSQNPPWGPPYFVRYGDPPPNGISRNHWAGNSERGGVSVWPAAFDFGRQSFVPDIGWEDEELLAFLSTLVRRPAYLVRGPIVGKGSAGEPLLYPVEEKVPIPPPTAVKWKGRALDRKEADAAVLGLIRSEDHSFERILETVLPYATKLARSSVLHGPTPHWRSVAWHGRRLAKQMEAGEVGHLENVAYYLESDFFLPQEVDLDVVRWFAALHDSQRLSDGRDPKHGERAAEKALGLWKAGIITLAHEQFALLYDALYDHAGPYISRDEPTIGCCWDADRLCLGRVGKRPDLKYLSTPPARGWVIRHREASRGPGRSSPAP